MILSLRARTLAIAVGVLALPSVAASSPSTTANLIVNGGFEQPVVGAGSYQLFGTGRSFRGWKVVGATGNVAPISTTFVQNGIHFISNAGKQWLDLTGLSNTKTGVAQTVKTAKGARYRLTFSIGNVVDTGGIFGTSSTVDVLVNGRNVLAATNRGGSKTRQAWKTFTVTVKATSAATTIEFLNGDASTDNDNGLDAIRLTKH